MGDLMEVLAKLEFLSDLTLISGDGTEFPVQKAVLAKESPFFRELFSSCVSDTGSRASLVFTEFNAEQLGVFIAAIYSLERPISEQNVKCLTEAARKYQLPNLLEACQEFCCNTISLGFVSFEPVIEWWHFAYQYDLQRFAEKCERRVKESTAGVIHSLGGEGKVLELLKSEEGQKIGAKLLVNAANGLSTASDKLAFVRRNVKKYGNELSQMVSSWVGPQNRKDKMASRVQYILEYVG